MSTRKRSSAIAGWLLTLAGTVTLVALACTLLVPGYRQMRLLSLLQGESSVDGIGVQSWLLLGSPLLLIGLGVTLTAISGDRSSAR